MKKYLSWLLFVLCVVIFFVAGYATGLVRGRGWVAAAVEAGCTLSCPTITVAELSVNTKGDSP